MRIATWNMQGATGNYQSKWGVDLKNFINAYRTQDLQLICLQECGTAPERANPMQGALMWGTQQQPANYGYYSYDFGTESRPDIWYIVIVFVGQRVNLGFISRVIPHICYYVPNVNPFQNARPAFGISPLQGDPVFFTVHAISPDGPDAPSLINQINQTIPQGTNWVAAGDYNREPDTWIPGAIPQGVRLLNHYPLQTHDNGLNLDYASYKGGNYARGEVVERFNSSDHRAVTYVIQ